MSRSDAGDHYEYDNNNDENDTKDDNDEDDNDEDDDGDAYMRRKTTMITATTEIKTTKTKTA